MISPGSLNALRVAYNGLMASQVGLDVVNHNISNANTEGYSRQRVTFQASDAFSNPSMGQTLAGGQIGMGVELQGVTRIHNTFFDGQIRNQTNVLNYHDEYADAMTQLEDILGATTGQSINDDVQAFFDSMHELSINPESIVARNAVLQQGEQMITQFQTKGQLIADLQASLVGDPNVAGSEQSSKLATMVAEINNQLAELAALNGEIITITASDGVPNDLYDKRDLLLENLSEFLDFDTSFKANGVVDVTIAGQAMVRGRQLSDTLSVVANPGPAPDPDFEPSLVRTTSGAFDITNNAAPNTVTSGKLKAIIDVAGGNTTEVTLRGALENLDLMLRTIATDINGLQTTGRDLNGNVPTDNIFLPAAPGAGLELFNYEVNSVLLANPDRIATAAGPPAAYLGPGDGSNALSMAQLNTSTPAALGGSSYVDYFNTMSSNLGVNNNSHKSRVENSGNILNNLDQSRQRVSGVNMEEEMVNLIQFQRTFEASSRVIQTVNEILQTVINLGR